MQAEAADHFIESIVAIVRAAAAPRLRRFEEVWAKGGSTLEKLEEGIHPQDLDDARTSVYLEAMCATLRHPTASRRAIRDAIAQAVHAEVRAAAMQRNRERVHGLRPRARAVVGPEDLVLPPGATDRFRAELPSVHLQRLQLRWLGISDKELAQTPLEAYKVLARYLGDAPPRRWRRLIEPSSARSQLTRARKCAAVLWNDIICASVLVVLLWLRWRIGRIGVRHLLCRDEHGGRGSMVMAATAMAIAATLLPLRVPSHPSPSLPPPGTVPASPSDPGLVLPLSGADVVGNARGDGAGSRAHVATPNLRGDSAAAGHTAASETPEDTQIITTTRAARFTGNRTLVAIGVGHTCRCGVLLRSQDGGGSWQAAPGPSQDATLIALPPDYPDDPRIFASGSPTGPTAPSVSDGFGEPFRSLSRLPAGPLALSGRFDDGDPTLYVAGLTGVVRASLQAPTMVPAVLSQDYGLVAPRPVITYPTAPGESAWIVSGPGSRGEDALVLAPHGSLATAPNPTSLLAGGQAPDGSAGPAIFACDDAAGCTLRAGVPLDDIGMLRASPAPPLGSSVIGFTSTRLALSLDTGENWISVPLPATMRTVLSAAVFGGHDGGWVWCICAGGDRHTHILRAPVATLEWSDVTGEEPADLRSTSVDPVTVDRTLILVSNGGYRCLVGAGLYPDWEPRCRPMY